MYTSFFGFKEKPFNLTPDPRYLFLSRYHREALDHLLYGVNERKGFIAITGGIGTGKTTLCRAFLSHLDSSTKSALIFNSFISDKELLKIITQEFGIETGPDAESKKYYIDALNQFLLENFGKGGNAVLLIDEAQNLSHSVLEQIRMLSNLETEKEKLMQIVLVGQPELRELLVTPSLRQLDERITVRYDLRPLNSRDIKGYVEHRLVVAGNRGSLEFTKGAFRKIFAYTLGNPRRINAVCDRSLLIAYAMEKHTVTKRMVTKAIEEVRGDLRGSSKFMDFSEKRLQAAALFVVFLIGITFFSGWIFREKISELFLSKQTVNEVIRPVPAPPEPAKPEKKPLQLFLDEQTSLGRLFNIFNANRHTTYFCTNGPHLELVSLDIEPEPNMIIKKPFRVQLPGPRDSHMPAPSYLLIKELSRQGAIVVDGEGKEQTVTREFVFRNWGKKVSWFFLYRDKNINLTRGTCSPDVSEVQIILRNTGYPVEPTGIFDESTFHEIVRFQKQYGLVPDGIVGPRTMALLYLMG